MKLEEALALVGDDYTDYLGKEVKGWIKQIYEARDKEICETCEWNEYTIAEMNKVMNKIYKDHKAEVKELKERITELRWKCDSTRWGA